MLQQRRCDTLHRPAAGRRRRSSRSTSGADGLPNGATAAARVDAPPEQRLGGGLGHRQLRPPHPHDLQGHPRGRPREGAPQVPHQPVLGRVRLHRRRHLQGEPVAGDALGGGRAARAATSASTSSPTAPAPWFTPAAASICRRWAGWSSTSSSTTPRSSGACSPAPRSRCWRRCARRSGKRSEPVRRQTLPNGVLTSLSIQVN